MASPHAMLGSQHECISDHRKSPRIAVAVVEEPLQTGVRRSTRDPSAAIFERNDVQTMLKRIRTDHQSTVILKIKHHIQSDINSAVFDAILEALEENTVCQVCSDFCNRSFAQLDFFYKHHQFILTGFLLPKSHKSNWEHTAVCPHRVAEEEVHLVFEHWRKLRHQYSCMDQVLW